MRIAHISDSHLGYFQYRLNERKEDFLKAFREAVRRAIEEKVDFIIHTGDLFESYHPDVSTISEAISVFKEIKDAGIPVFSITGNHDRVLRRGYSPPHRILKDLDLIELIDPVGDLNYEGVYIAGMRYFPKTYMKGIKERFFSKFSENAQRADFSIFMFHQGLDQYLYYDYAYELNISDLPEGFNYYAGGHIHAFIRTNFKGGILSYAGSTEFRSKREVKAGRRGFNIFNLETGELQRVELQSLREFFVIETDEERAPEELRELLEKVKDCREKPVVLVNYSYKNSDLNSLEELIEKLKKHSLIVKISENRLLDEEQTITTENKSYGEIYEEFLKSQGAPKEVISIGRQIVDGSPNDVHQIVEGFLKEFLGEAFDGFKKFSEAK